MVSGLTSFGITIRGMVAETMGLFVNKQSQKTSLLSLVLRQGAAAERQHCVVMRERERKTDISKRER